MTALDPNWWRPERDYTALELAISGGHLRDTSAQTKVGRHRVLEIKAGHHDAGWRGATDVLDRLKEPDSGFTIDPASGTQPTKGYAVALRGHSSITPAHDFFAPGANGEPKGIKIIDDWLAANADVLSQPGAHIGGWHDPAHDEIVLDPAQVVTDKARALALSKEQNQQAMADLEAIANGDWANAIIPTGGTGDRPAGKRHRTLEAKDA